MFYIDALPKPEVSTTVGRWVTFDPAELPILLGWKCCGPAPLNIIPKIPKQNRQFCEMYHRNPVKFRCLYAWLSSDTKCCLKTVLIKNSGVWGIISKYSDGGRYIGVQSNKDAFIHQCSYPNTDWYLCSLTLWDDNGFLWTPIIFCARARYLLDRCPV